MPLRTFNLWASLVLLLVATGILFWGSPEGKISRSIHEIWDLGHVIYFALFSYLLLSMNGIRRRPLWIQWVIVLIISLLIGITIELLQIGTERSADPQDVVRDLIGSLLVLSFATGWNQRGKGRYFFLGMRLIILIWTLILLKPLMVSLIDEAIARSEFPVLSDFSNPLSIGRWETNTKLVLESPPGMSDTPSLRVDLLSLPYAVAFLSHFDGDWRGYERLQITLYNPAPRTLKLRCRIHDLEHQKGPQPHEDRFGSSFLLEPGLNQITIGLDEIATAPKSRRMDLSQIFSVGLFSKRIETPQALYILRVWLE